MFEILFFSLCLLAFLLLCLARWGGHRPLQQLWQEQSDFFAAQAADAAPAVGKAEAQPYAEDAPALPIDQPIERSLCAAGTHCPHAVEVPAVSVVMVSEGNGALLADNLPYILQQTHPNFEVIVVDASTPAVATSLPTSDVLKRFQQSCPHLRHTYVPTSSRHIDRRILGYTLGIRAARAPWVVLTEPDCVPASYDWLKCLMRFADDETDVVVGAAGYFKDSSEPSNRRLRFERLENFLGIACRLLRGHAVGADSCNVLLRQSWFLEAGGFPHTVFTPAAALSRLIASRADARRVALALYPDTFVRQQSPPELAIPALHRRYLLPPGRRHRVPMLHRESLADVAVVLFIIAFLAYVALRMLRYLPLAGPLRSVVGSVVPYSPVYDWQWLALDVLLLLVVVASLWLSYTTSRRLSRLFEEEPFGFYPVIYHVLLPWRRLRARCGS